MPDSTADETSTQVKGSVKQAVGWATGDREVEAEGAVEATTGHEPDEAEEASKQDEVRRSHGDLGTADLG